MGLKDALSNCCSKESQTGGARLLDQMLDGGANVKPSPTDICVNCYSAKDYSRNKKKSRD